SGQLGLSFQRVTPELAAALGLSGTGGALIDEVRPGKAAAQAGLASGDVIVSIDGRPVTAAEELLRAIGRRLPGTRITITFVRNRQPRTVAAVLDRAPRDEDQRSAAERGRAQGEAGRSSATRLAVRVSNAPDGGARVDDVTDPNRAGDITPGDV